MTTSETSAIDAKVLARVRKLLAQAEHPTTSPEEAEAFSAKAAELMAKYVVDQSLLDAAAPDHTAPLARTIRVVAPYAMAKAVLLSAVAAGYGVRTVIGGEAAGGRDCTAVGFALDLEATELLFTSLLLQAAAAMHRASQRQDRPRAFRRAFLLGYAGTVSERLRSIREQTVAGAASAGAGGAALVLADRAREVDTAVQQRFPRLRNVRTTVSDRDGLLAGRAAGADADLGTRSSRVTGPRAAALG
jgi:hypothetical protein